MSAHSLFEHVKRWTFGRKAAVVEAVRDGSVSLDDVLRVHGITQDEFATWAAGLNRRRRYSDASLMLPKPYWFHGLRPLRRQRDIQVTLVDMFGDLLDVTIPAHEAKVVHDALGRALEQIPRLPKVRQFEFPRAVS